MFDFLPWIQYLLSPAVALGLIAFPAKKYVDHLISRSATTQEQQYRKELSQLVDERKHNHDKDLKNFAYFIEKKFEIYTKLYEKTHLALGALSGLTGLRYVPDFEKYTEEDLIEYLDKHEFYKSDKTDYLQQFSQNRREASSKLRKEMLRRDFIQANMKMFDAKNYFIVNQLFVSDELEEKFEKFFHLLVSNLVEWESFLQHNYSIDLKKLRSEEEERDLTMKEIKLAMKLELRNTYLGKIEI